MLKKEIEKILNEQITKEVYSSNIYLSMASWCETRGLRGSTKFFYEQSDEERQHMLKICRYINASGGHALIPQVKQPAVEFDSIQHVFATSLEQEMDVTKSIHKLVELALAEKDYGTFNFLQWFVAEQQEEENLFKSILDLIKLAGEDKNLLLIDQSIEKFKDNARGLQQS